MPVYTFEAPYLKIQKFKQQYGKLLYFRSQQLVKICNQCKDVKPGIYVLATIMINGAAKLVTLDGSNSFIQSVNSLIETGFMKPFQKRK